MKVELAGPKKIKIKEIRLGGVDNLEAFIRGIDRQDLISVTYQPKYGFYENEKGEQVQYVDTYAVITYMEP